MPKRIRTVILCEDRQQEVFARCFLTVCGIRPVRVQVSPSGKEAYPRLSKESECKPEVEALAKNRRNPLPEEAPPSLRAACLELPRVITEIA